MCSYPHVQTLAVRHLSLAKGAEREDEGWCCFSQHMDCSLSWFVEELWDTASEWAEADVASLLSAALLTALHISSREVIGDADN